MIFILGEDFTDRSHFRRGTVSHRTFFVPNFRRGHSFAMILRYDGEDKVTRRIKEARFAIYLDGISQGRRTDRRKMDGRYRAEKYGL